MSFTHTLAWSYTSVGDQISSNVSVSAELETKLDAAFTAANDQELVFTLDYSQCKGFFMVSDQDCSVETNSSSAAAQTFTMLADIPLAWTYGDGACPVTTDITKLFVSSAVAGTLKVRALVDGTI